MNKKLLLTGGLIAAVLAIGGAWWQRDSSRAEQTDTALVLQGNVDIRQVSLAFNASERIASLAVNEGDHVKAGQLLGLLDLRTAKARFDQADAQVEVSGQALARLRAGSRPEEIAQAQANVAAAQADSDLAHQQVLRLQRVRDATANKGISQQDLDDALSRDKVDASRLQAARQSAEIVIKGPRKEDIAQALGQLDAARAQRALIGRELAESELHSPTDAVVRARLLEPGDMASPQRPVYTLAITQPKWVRTYLREADLARVRPGMTAQVTTDSDPRHPIAGKVGYISSVAEFTPKTVETPELRTSLVYELRVLVDDPQDTLRLGMPATVRLDTARAPAHDRAAP
jgi:HlyD family secretion protein